MLEAMVHGEKAMCQRKKEVGITSSPSFQGNNLASHLTGKKKSEAIQMDFPQDPTPPYPPIPQNLCPSIPQGHHLTSSPLHLQIINFPSSLTVYFVLFLLFF